MSNQIDGKLYNISVQTYIQQVTSSIKFPCVFFLQWRTNDQKSATQSAKHSPQGDKVVFDQTITLNTNIIYDKEKKCFCKKQSQLQLNLISKSKPDQSKLVGRLTFDLATFMNENPYPSLTQIPLNFCSVNAFIILSVKVIEKIETDISVHEHEKSMSEGLSLGSSFKVSAPNFGQQKSIQILNVMKDSSQVGSRNIQVLTPNKEYSGDLSSPRSIEQNAFRVENVASKIKPITPTTSIKDIRQLLDQNTKSKSFKTAKSEDEQVYESRRIVSSASEVDKQEVLRVKAQLQTLKIQSSKKLQEQERTRYELQNKIKESQFVKLQLRQKQGLIDQANAQINLLKNQNTRLRDENAKIKDQSVKLTLKVSEIKDSSNRSQQQLLTLEKELKRYEKVGLNLNSASQINKQLTSQMAQLKKKLSESEKMVNSLGQQKAQLQELINLKDLDYLRRQEEWNYHRSSQSSNKQSLLIQLSAAQQKYKAESKLKLQLQNKANQLSQQVTRLTEISNEFIQAKNSWQITEGMFKEEIKVKTVRISQLQEAIISTGDRVRWLQGEIELMDESNKQSRQQYLRLQQQKNIEKNQLMAQIQKMNQFIRQLNETILKIEDQKNQLINTLNSLLQKYDHLNKEHEGQIIQNNALLENYDQVSKNFNDYKQRCAQFEQLLLSSNQMREKQCCESAEKEKSMYLRIIELQNQLTNTNDHILLDQDRIQMLDSELKNREDLVSKLQVGLQRQIQRSEDLNVKLLGYMERAEKMKDIMTSMEDQQRRVIQLIIEQEVSQARNKEIVQEKQRSMLQLLSNLQSSINHGKSLQQTLSIRQMEFRAQIDMLNVQLNELNSKIQQLQETLKSKEDCIVMLECNIAQNNQIIAEKDRKAQQTEYIHTQDIEAIKQSKSQLQSNMLDLENQILRLNDVIFQKDSQINQKGQKCNSIQQQLLKQQTEKGDLSAKITQLLALISQLQNQINDLNNEVLLKQELIQEQTNRYNQLATQHDNLQKDQATFDISEHKRTLKDRDQTIGTLQQKIMQLQKENSKISTLERSIKIKTIQLNSMKFKGKGQPVQSNQLLKLKDQEIASLIAEKEKLSTFQTECVKLQEKIVALQTEIEHVEEEKFNIESDSNEKALLLEEVKEENRKLMQEITIIGQKNSELQKIIAGIASNQAAGKKSNTQVILQKPATNSKKGRQQNTSSSNALSLAQTLKLVKQAVDERVKSRLSDKLLQMIDKITAKQAIKDSSVQVKLKSLSKDFSKLKIVLLKVVQSKSGPQKTKFTEQIKNCETVLTSVLNLLE